MFQINETWKDYLAPEFRTNSFSEVLTFLEKEKVLGTKIYPPENKIFRAFDFFSPMETKVVILGQDPYHGEGEADGLAFSISSGARPPSLNNIFKELKTDLRIDHSSNSLEGWASQGVLLLNTSLTVEANKPLSHERIGWNEFVTRVLYKIDRDCPHVVFVLWGTRAQSFEYVLSKDKHTVIKSNHPSPLSAYRGFFGSRPFSKINSALRLHSQAEIDWSK